MILETLIFTALPTFVLGYITLFIVRFLLRYRQWNNAYNHATSLGPRKPIFGHMYLFQDSASLLNHYYDLIEKTRGKVFSGFVLCFPNFSLNHPDTIKILMKSSEQKPVGFGGSYEAIRPWLGDGLLLSHGPKWERNRRLLTPAFHFDILMPYVRVYNDVVDVFLNKVWRLQEKSPSGWFEVYQHVGLATLDTMLRCAFSYEGNVQTENNHPYAMAVKRLTNLTYKRAVNPFKWLEWVYFNLWEEGKEYKKLLDYVHKFADNVIEVRKASLESNPSQQKKRHLDFLDILLTAKDETGKGLASGEIRAEVDTFLFEGHDTTASAISWAIYALGKYPEEQQKVSEEICTLTSKNGYIDWDELPKLRYLHLFIREVLRMYNPVPIICRRLTQTTSFEDVEVQAGMTVDINLCCLHHNPDVYPDHKVFRPDRFSDEDFEKRDPYSFVPFSAGSRNCIGQNFAMHEMKVFIARLLQRFTIEVDSDHDIVFVPESVMRAKHGIMIKVKEKSTILR